MVTRICKVSVITYLPTGKKRMATKSVMRHDFLRCMKVRRNTLRFQPPPSLTSIPTTTNANHHWRAYCDVLTWIWKTQYSKSTGYMSHSTCTHANSLALVSLQDLSTLPGKIRWWHKTPGGDTFRSWRDTCYDPLVNSAVKDNLINYMNTCIFLFHS